MESLLNDVRKGHANAFYLLQRRLLVISYTTNAAAPLLANAAPLSPTRVSKPSPCGASSRRSPVHVHCAEKQRSRTCHRRRIVSLHVVYGRQRQICVAERGRTNRRRRALQAWERVLQHQQRKDERLRSVYVSFPHRREARLSANRSVGIAWGLLD